LICYGGVGETVAEDDPARFERGREQFA
jgi:hypothetical protein